MKITLDSKQAVKAQKDTKNQFSKKIAAKYRLA